MNEWPKKPTVWIENRVAYASVPFTWNLPDLKVHIQQSDFEIDRWVVGGPAVRLMPDYLADVAEVRLDDMLGVLQRVNPQATRSTVGCPNRCAFCAVPKTEGELVELDDWPDLPVYCDNNILAASEGHFDQVMDRLEGHGWGDFNQGIDARKLAEYHAERFGRVKGLIVRLALDNSKTMDAWEIAWERLRRHGVAKSRIRSYVLVAFDGGVEDAWRRCEFVQDHGALALPQWFHELDAMDQNIVTDTQSALGWNDFERQRIMGYYYQHRGEKLAV